MEIDKSIMKTKQSKSNMTVGEFISKLFEARIQTHIWHLNTKSYAAHIALGSFYNDIVDLTDSVAEAWQGKYGIIKGYKQIILTEAGNPIQYLTSLRTCVEDCRNSCFSDKDTNIQNEIDNIITLLDSTIYKLTNLS